MREIRTSGSEGGGAGNSTGSSYPYRAGAHKGRPGHIPRTAGSGAHEPPTRRHRTTRAPRSPRTTTASTVRRWPA